MVEKLEMKSSNVVQDHIKEIQKLFPNAVTEISAEGGTTLAIDFEILKQELSNVLIDEKQERYQMTWPDKKKSILLSNSRINATLRPIKEKSVNFDDTGNIYIEGDNLDVLKLIRETYLEKIDFIYLDPPYNTGEDFIYNDDYSLSSEEYINNSGQYDDLGNRLVVNSESNGRFHSDWLNMIYPRLKIARDLLKPEGIIAISIGQNEISNMQKICDEIFSEHNKCGIVSRLMKSGGGKGKFFSPNVEYILFYAKNITLVSDFREPISEEIMKKLYTSTEISGPRAGEKYRPFGLYQSSLDPLRGCTNQRYYIEAPDGTLLIPPGNVFPSEAKEGAQVKPISSDDKVWRWTKERFLKEKENGNIEFKKSNGVLLDSNGNPAGWNVYTKIWLSERQEDGMVPVDLITKWENRLSAKELLEMNIPFDFAKPSELIKYLITIVNNKKDILVMDFFSGSATTAHSIMKMNAEDGGHRKYIMVQLPEIIDEDSEAYKSGYKSICDIGEERIRRAGKKILEDYKKGKESDGLFAITDEKTNLDIGFRVLKLDSSNMNDVYYNANATSQSLFDNTVDNVKSDRTPLDLLFQVMLELGIELSAKIEEKEVLGKKYFIVNENDIVACFDNNVSNDVIKELAKIKPIYAVFRDSVFENDAANINCEQLFKSISPSTTIKVL